jgi:hypothetical protein
MRQSVIEAFQEIADLVKKDREELEKGGVKDVEDVMPNYLIPSFTNIQNIQAVIAHDSLVCTTQFQNAIDKLITDSQGNKNTIIRFILEFLLRVPIDPAVRSVRCSSMPQSSEKQENSGEININNPQVANQQTYTKEAISKAQLV